MQRKKKLNLTSLIGKQVEIKDRYDNNKKQGPFEILAVDSDCGFICLRVDGQAFWWTLNTIEGIREVV